MVITPPCTPPRHPRRSSSQVIPKIDLLYPLGDGHDTVQCLVITTILSFYYEEQTKGDLQGIHRIIDVGVGVMKD